MTFQAHFGTIARKVHASTSFLATTEAVLLVNPVAGRGRGLRSLSQVQKVLQAAGVRFEAQVSNSAEDLARHALAAAARGAALLVVGGDGTVQTVVNAVREHPEAVIGVLPAGGGDDLAMALKLPKDTVAAAKSLLHGAVRPIDLALAKTVDGVERLYVGGAGAGLDAEASELAGTRYSQVPSRFRYLLSAIDALRRHRKMHVRVSGDRSDLKFETDALLVAVLNTPSYGAGLHLAPGAKLSDGQLDVVIVEELGALEILQVLPGLLASGSLHSRRVRRFLTSRVCIETDSPVRFHADGEVCGCTPVEITVTPGKLRLLAPQF